jgi:hypothetical protein
LFKIRKARETGNINYLSNILLEEIQDLQERKEKIQQRLQQFYPELKVQPGESKNGLNFRIFRGAADSKHKILERANP